MKSLPLVGRDIGRGAISRLRDIKEKVSSICFCFAGHTIETNERRANKGSNPHHTKYVGIGEGAVGGHSRRKGRGVYVKD